MISNRLVNNNNVDYPNLDKNMNFMSNRHQLMIRPDGRCLVLTKRTGFNGGNSATSNCSSDTDEQPVSRTYQYRKIMKPMLERKRRARINRCLDELKELMLTALQSEGENVSKLEKADILELTVRHLHKLRRQRSLGLSADSAYSDKFRAGFTHCAAEVSQYLASIIQQEQQNLSEKPSAADAEKLLQIDHSSSVKLLQHLGSCIQRIENSNSRYDDPLINPYTTPPSSPSPNPLLLSIQDGNASSIWRPW